ncbi:MAG TPA: hypothetical protein VIQ54_14695 [Polyangia bacterium]
MAAPAVRPEPKPVVAVAREPKPGPTAPAKAAAVPAAASAGDTMQECQAAVRRERAKQAMTACTKAASANPVSADAMALLAHANLLSGRDRETLRLARAAAELDPKCADAYLLIGTVQQAAGQTSDARSAYESYLRVAPNGSYAAEIRAILKSL